MTRIWALAALAASYLGLCACAPMVTLPGPAPLTATHPNDVGGAGVVLIAHNPPRYAVYSPYAGFGGMQAWYLRRMGPVWDFGMTVGGGNAQFLSGGLLARARLVHRDRFSVGFQLGAGALWADGGLFVAGAFGTRVWVYAAPTAGARFLTPVRLPIGVQVRPIDAVSIGLEGGVGYPASLQAKTSLLTGEGEFPAARRKEMYFGGLGVDYRF